MNSLLLNLLAAAQIALSGITHDAPPFSPGERLHYRGYLFGWIPLGDVWFEVKRTTYNGRDAFQFDARALGHYLIYTLDIRLRSVVDAENMRSVMFERRQVGTEKLEYRVVFNREAMRAEHYRKKGKFATVEEMDASPWRLRSAFPINPEVNDILYTLYFARNIGDRVGTKKYYWFVETSYIWKTIVTIIGEKEVDLGRAGRFDALKVAIEPDYSQNPEKGEKFSGLFGVTGSLEVLVDKKTRIPLVVTGRLPFAYIFSPTVGVVLQDYSIPKGKIPNPKSKIQK